MTTDSPAELCERMKHYAGALHTAGAIRTEPVHRAFATVPRHRFLRRFYYRTDQHTLNPQQTPPAALLDIIYANNALFTHDGTDGDPTSSTSAPSLMAKMLEALQLRPGMAVLEIGAGTGYNAALITTITGAQVTSIEAGKTAATNATETIAALGLDRKVTIVHGDGYHGDPNHHPDTGRYERIIATCGIAGIPLGWLDQLAPGGMILAPIAHAGVHPILAITPALAIGTAVTGRCLMWADFMPAAGPLRPTELFAHDPANPIPAQNVRTHPEALPAMGDAQYQDLAFYLAVHDPRATRAYLDHEAFDPAHGATALVDDNCAAWIQQRGAILTTGNPATTTQLHAQLTDLAARWHTAHRPPTSSWICEFANAKTTTPLLHPQHWIPPSPCAIVGAGGRRNEAH